MYTRVGIRDQEIEDMKVLIFTPLTFFSPEDEDLFFAWIDKVGCVKSYKGIGRELHLEVEPSELTFNDLRNLRGLFSRYGLKNPGQLKELFLDDSNKRWFVE